MISIRSHSLHICLKHILTVFLIFYLLLSASYFESDILNSKMWQKRSAAFVVFDARKSFSVLFQSVLAPGLRSTIVDFLWIEIHDLFHQGLWYKLPEYLETVTILQPEYLLGWEVASWHLGYNITDTIRRSQTLSEEQKTTEMAWWWKRATDMLKSGIIINNDTYRLYFVLGWMYFHKVQDYDNAIKYLSIAARFPDHIGFVDRNLAYAYEKKGNKQKALEIFKKLLKDKNYHKDDPFTLRVLESNISRLDNEVKKQ